MKQLKNGSASSRFTFEYIDERVSPLDNLRELGKKIVGSQYGAYWRYRVGDVRIMCDIKDQKLIILVVEVGHRKEIYC